MPWCPNCRNEYKEGVENCAECGTPLTDSLEEELLLLETLTNETAAEKLTEFLEYEGISRTAIYEGAAESEVEVHVPASEWKEAKKLLSAFLEAETTEEEKQEFQKKKEDRQNSAIYVKKEERYKDFMSSAWTFLFFGIIGLIFLAINAVGILHIISGWFSLGISGALFVAFLLTSLYTFRKAASIRAGIAQENDLTDQVAAWLEANVTEDLLNQAEDSAQSTEYNDMLKLDRLKELLLAEFPSLPEAYAEQLAEEFYNKHF